MAERALKHEKIRFVWNAVITDVLGGGSVSGIRVRDVKSNEEREIACRGLFVALGHVPNTELFKGKLAMDAAGYLTLKDGTSQTDVAGVFAAGDCADPRYRQAITAAAAGCRAAIDAERYLG